jgi:Ca2+/Na+ antiporter
MLLLAHIVSAVLGIVLSTVSLISPSSYRIRASYLFVLGTIATGTIIIIKDHLSILSVCLSGLLYIGFTVSSLVAASHRLARQRNSID